MHMVRQAQPDQTKKGFHMIAHIITSFLDASSSHSEFLVFAVGFVAGMVANPLTFREGYAIISNTWPFTRQECLETPSNHSEN